MAIGTLRSNVRIVDASGNPTPEFLRAWNALLRGVGGPSEQGPSTPTGLAFSIEAGGVRLQCTENPAAEHITAYQWRLGATWDSGLILVRYGTNDELIPSDQVGVYTVWVAAADIRGLFSQPASMSVTVTDADLGLYSPKVTLVASGKDFNNGTPASITLTTLLLNLPTPNTYVWKVNGVVDGAALTGTYVVAAFHGSPKTIRVEVTSGVTGLTTADEYIIQAIDGDVTATILSSAATTITMASSTLLQYTSGSAGIFFGSGGLFGKNAAGNVTFSIVGSTGAATFKGDVTTSGLATFDGLNTSGGNTWAGVFNGSGGSYGGALAYAGAGGIGFRGIATSGIGLSGSATAAGGTGVIAGGSGGANALVVSGPLLIDNSTLVTNLNAQYLNGNASTAFLTTGGTAADSSKLGGVAASGYAHIVVGDTGTATVSSGLNMNMGTGLAPTYQVACSGNNIVLQAVSDVTLKQDIADETLGMPFVKMLRPRRFRFISDPEYQQHGFIAQELAAVAIPNAEKDALAFTNPDGKMGINHLALIGPMVKSIQELDARIKALGG